jgi:hypothetical protein
MGSALSGHRMAPSELVTRTMNVAHRRLPEVMQALVDRALATPFKCEHCGKLTSMGPGDREAQIYLLDRVMGRPRQEIDARVSAEVSLAPGDYARLALLQSAIGIAANMVIDVPARDDVRELPAPETSDTTEPSSPPQDSEQSPADPDIPTG